jgi:hypothetical protein
VSLRSMRRAGERVVSGVSMGNCVKAVDKQVE